MTHPVSHEVIQAALTYIPANDRDLWLRVGMALKAELGDHGWSTFETWSLSADNYDDKAAKASWKSFKLGGKVSIGTLIHEAQQRGFDPKQYAPATPISAEELQRLKAERLQRDATAEQETKRKQAAAAKNAVTAWDAASPEGSSPYLQRKAILGHGVRYHGDVLYIPVMDRNGTLWNVQRIFANGDKRFYKDGIVSGCFHVVGDIDASEWLLIAEGYATAASLHEITGYPVVIAFFAHNLKHVAALMRERYPTKTMLICADDDSESAAKTGVNAGLEAAAKVAEQVHAHCCQPIGLQAGETDFNDLALSSGKQAVRDQIAAAMNQHSLTDEQTVMAALDVPDTLHASDVQVTPSTLNDPAEGVSANEVVPAQESSKAAKRTKQTQARPATPSAEHASKPFFTNDERGVWFHGFNQQGDPLPAQWICSSLSITAKSRDAVNGSWGYLLEFNDPDGNPKRWAMPASMLAGDGNQYRQALLDMGLLIGAGLQAKNQLTVYIQTTDTDARVRCVDRIGWHDDVYVLPDYTIGDSEDRVMFQAAGGVVSQFKQKGRLDDWRTNVSSHCRGNSRLLFCVSAGFAATLLHHSGVPSGGFHIWGDSSSGKSTAFKVAGSVFGGRDYPRNWRMTDNALETVAAQHSDALLLLDEIAQVDPKVVGDTVYMLANETGKSRATQTATARKSHTWRILFLSDGEVSLASHMAEAGKGTRGGHDVRMAHITADAGKGFGVFDTLHDFANGAALSDHLVKMSQQYYGTAGLAFIERAVAKADTLPNSLRKRVGDLTRELCPQEAHGQVSRVASRFALVGIAGELATGAGITGWAEGEAISAARTCFADWLASRGGAGNVEHSAMLSQVVDFIQRHGESRLTWWHRAMDDHKPNTINRAGFKKQVTKDGTPINSNSDYHKEYGDKMHPAEAEGAGIEYYFFADVWKNEICKGYSHKAVADLLLKHGCLIPATTAEGQFKSASRSERLPSVGNARCYKITADIMNLQH
ncbi:DUF927 domain-containing protein [Undibacterium terreum]|uniref:Toprim domain-containing protein n=1 Tax=Undibacterium terreum TaxID=1224302 RepID=A0A916V165_9BURK|nr:DUF927 domain-containing protein [Undibacterium terreum]GGC98737.1 hypothetical protein GCM10011396_52840 [Undibacterium terreum]